MAHGRTVVLADDGTTSRSSDDPSDGSRPADVGRLTVLTLAETSDIITLLAEAHTGQPPPPADQSAPPQPPRRQCTGP